MARRALVSVWGGSKCVEVASLQSVTTHAYLKIRAAITCLLPTYFQYASQPGIQALKDQWISGKEEIFA